MHDCNRHRPNGYKDVTYGAQIGVEVIEDFANKRSKDYDRSQNVIHKRFPSLSEARDAYIRAGQRT